MARITPPTASAYLNVIAKMPDAARDVLKAV
jgi:hypothetical protein